MAHTVVGDDEDRQDYKLPHSEQEWYTYLTASFRFIYSDEGTSIGLPFLAEKIAMCRRNVF